MPQRLIKLIHTFPGRGLPGRNSMGRPERTDMANVLSQGTLRGGRNVAENRPRPKSRYGTSIARWGLIFAAPAVCILFVFNILPMLRAIVLSFTNYSLGGTMSFIGVDNYVRLLTGTEFPATLLNTVIYVMGTVVPVWFLSFLAAYLIYRTVIAPGIWRTILFLPTVLPLLTVTLVWKLLFHYNGPVNMLLEIFDGERVAWLTRSQYAPLAMIIMSWWHAISYYMILFLAGLQSVPRVYEEAAQLDGARGLMRMFRITLPLMRPTIVLVVLLSILKGFQTFAIQQVMTGGGPGIATQIVTLLIYKTAFMYGSMGEASAISVLYFLLILVFSLLQLKVMRGNERVI
jgi:ABC-type sugar transport system permease subunit